MSSTGTNHADAVYDPFINVLFILMYQLISLKDIVEVLKLLVLMIHMDQ